MKWGQLVQLCYDADQGLGRKSWGQSWGELCGQWGPCDEPMPAVPGSSPGHPSEKHRRPWPPNRPPQCATLAGSVGDLAEGSERSRHASAEPLLGRLGWAPLLDLELPESRGAEISRPEERMAIEWPIPGSCAPTQEDRKRDSSAPAWDGRRSWVEFLAAVEQGRQGSVFPCVPGFP